MTLSGVVECDEVYVVAGHTLWGASKGQPEKVAPAGRKPRCRRLQGAPGRRRTRRARSEKPPVFGMIQRTGEVVIRMLDNVQQATIKPLILQTIMPGTQTYTGEYNIYSRLEAWGYPHKTVNHSAGEYARDEDGDGFCEVHSNTMEGIAAALLAAPASRHITGQVAGLFGFLPQAAVQPSG